MRKLPKHSVPSYLLGLLAFLTSTCIITLLVSTFLTPLDRPVAVSPTAVEHIAFGIASGRQSWPRRRDFVRLWWEPRLRGCVFVGEESDPRNLTGLGSGSLPPVCVSGDTSEFRYTNKHGFRTALRITRLVKETVELNLPNSQGFRSISRYAISKSRLVDPTGVRWFVFGDDDTVIIPENLAKTLSKYNHEQWYYIGANSEVYEQNKVMSFGTAFGGGGFAISSPLARVLAKVLDSCINRYPHLYGSDSRISSCLTELGVGLTIEPGFHQMDVRGDTFGVLASHPLTPLVSLHHLEHATPIFPNMSHHAALSHLFQAVKADSERVLQQTVCYDHWFSWTVSVSWGYAVQIFERNMLLPDALRVQQTFSTWKEKGVNELSKAYMFDTQPVHLDPCRRPTVFFFDEVDDMGKGLSRSRYRRMVQDGCRFDPMISPKKLEEVVVFSPKSNLGLEQLQAPRRQCCDVLPRSTDDRVELHIRECKADELTYMHP